MILMLESEEYVGTRTSACNCLNASCKHAIIDRRVAKTSHLPRYTDRDLGTLVVPVSAGAIQHLSGIGVTFLHTHVQLHSLFILWVRTRGK